MPKLEQQKTLSSPRHPLIRLSCFRLSLLRKVQCMLLTLFPLALYSTWYLLYYNGTADLMAHIRDIGPQILPGTSVPLKEVYTGFKDIDYQLTVLALFFWEIVDGSIPHASLHAFHFAGQIAAAWGLIMIESIRAGNRWKLVSFIMVWGLLLQIFSLTVVMPLYFALHLSTSSTTSPSRVTISARANELRCIVYSISIGYIIPSALSCLPAPSVLSFEMKQNFMAIWQAFPIWVSLLQRLFAYTSSRLRPTFPISKKVDDKITVDALRSAYIVLLTIAGLSHLLTASVMMASMITAEYPSSGYASSYHPKKVTIPMSIMSSTKVSSIGQGAHLLLQYDEFFGSIAFLVWATFLYTTPFKGNSAPKCSKLLLQIVSLTVLTGPMGCAVKLIWSRDGMIYEPIKKTEVNETRDKESEMTSNQYRWSTDCFALV